MLKLFIWTPIVGCVLNLITVIVCYGLAVKNIGGDWILAPSTIGTNGLAGTLFTIGFTLAGLFYLKTSIMRHLLLTQTLRYLERENLMLLKKLHELNVLNVVSTVFGCLGSVLVCLVGLRKFIGHYQDVFIIIVPYGLQVVCMCANTRMNYVMRRRKSFFYLFVLSLCASIVLVIAMIFIWFEDSNLRCIASAAEYILVIAVVRFISLHFNDFQNSNFMSLDRLDTNINISPISRHIINYVGNGPTPDTTSA